MLEAKRRTDLGGEATTETGLRAREMGEYASASSYPDMLVSGREAISSSVSDREVCAVGGVMEAHSSCRPDRVGVGRSSDGRMGGEGCERDRKDIAANCGEGKGETKGTRETTCDVGLVIEAPASGAGETRE